MGGNDRLKLADLPIQPPEKSKLFPRLRGAGGRPLVVMCANCWSTYTGELRSLLQGEWDRGAGTRRSRPSVSKIPKDALLRLEPRGPLAPSHTPSPFYDFILRQSAKLARLVSNLRSSCLRLPSSWHQSSLTLDSFAETQSQFQAVVKGTPAPP